MSGRHTRPLYPRERTMVPTEQEAEWDPPVDLDGLEKKKPLARTGVRSPHRPARNLVATPTELSRLQPH